MCNRRSRVRVAHRRRGAAHSARCASSDLAKDRVRASAQQFAKLVRELPMTLKVAADAARGAGNLIGRLRDSVMLAPRTPFNAQVGPRRSYAVASLPLDAVKQVARHFGASLNDVVLALCAGDAARLSAAAQGAAVSAR